MSKLYRSSRAPAGAHIPLRNTRLYGDRDTQIETASLRARGCPNPDNAYVPSRKRDALRIERETAAHARRLQAAKTAMLQAQDAVRAAKARGENIARLAVVARERRADYLRLTGGVERKTVDAPIAANR